MTRFPRARRRAYQHDSNLGSLSVRRPIGNKMHAKHRRKFLVQRPVFKGTLPYPKPTPIENPRRKLKISKPTYPRRLDEGCLVGKEREKKICGFGPVRIPAETASRSFRKLAWIPLKVSPSQLMPAPSRPLMVFLLHLVLPCVGCPPPGR